MTEQYDVKSSLVRESALATIPNNHPTVTMHVRLIYPFEQLCPVSSEPQAGSTITIGYDAGATLLETKSLQRYLASFAGNNPYGVRDLEEAAQVIAQQCADILKVPVYVVARYHLHGGDMEVEVRAEPRA